MKRYVLWAVLVLAVAGFAAVMIPGSPVSLQNTIGEPTAEGKPLRVWTADLGSPDREVRLTALSVIGSIAPQAGRAAGRVGEVLAGDADAEVRERAANVLSKMGAGSKPALDGLRKGLAGAGERERQFSALALLALKTDALPAVPDLVKAIDDPKNDAGAPQTIQAVAAAALGATRSPDAVAPLTAAVAAGKPLSLRTAAARSLGQIGAPAKSAVPALKACLSESDTELKEEAVFALRELGETVADVVKPQTDPAAYAKGAKSNSFAVPADGEPKGGDPKGKK